MNNMAEKLIKDSRNNTRIRQNLFGIKLGATFLVTGFLLLLAALWAPIEMENFLGTGFELLSFLGVATFLLVAVKSIVERISKG